jgi:hypothetical protein
MLYHIRRQSRSMRINVIDRLIGYLERTPRSRIHAEPWNS